MDGFHDKDQFLSAFERLQGKSGSAPSWLRDLRRAAMASFDRLGFPTSRDEEWRYTSVEPIRSTVFQSPNGEGKGLRPADLRAVPFIDPVSTRLVFVNGVFSPELSSPRDFTGGLRLERLSAASAMDDGSIGSHLGRYASYREQSFIALNTALAEEGAFVSVPAGMAVSEPIYLVYVSVGNSAPIVSHPRSLIVLETASQARVVECYIGVGEQPCFANAVTEIVGGENAVLDHYRLQRDASAGSQITALEARLNRNCSLTAHALTFGGALVRNDVHAVLDGEGAECVLNGLYLLDGKDHVDNHTEIEHVKPRTTSHELYKGILSGASRAVFNGKIRVHKDAQKTDARQTNRNLLLSENAMVNTKPQLEIHADDVKCSHGSTIGQLDRDALFYLRSRGLDRSDAESLLSYAFASDVVGRIRIESLRDQLDGQLLARFRRKTER